MDEQKSKIKWIVERLKRKRFTYTQDHPGETYNDARIKDTLNWFQWLHRKCPKQYKKVVKIYEQESFASLEEFKAKGLASVYGVPYLPTQFDSLKKFDLKLTTKRRGRQKNPEIEQRNKLISELKAQGYTNNDICYELDERNTPVPSGWKIDTWSNAYVSRYRSKVDVLIAKAIRKINS